MTDSILSQSDSHSEGAMVAAATAFMVLALSVVLAGLTLIGVPFWSALAYAWAAALIVGAGVFALGPLYDSIWRVDR